MNQSMDVYELGFALDEVTLFLDTHPDHAEALEYYRRIKQQYAEAVKEYERTCAPLTLDRLTGYISWLWAKPPGPWYVVFICVTLRNDCNTR